MPAPTLATVPLSGDVAAALAQLPAAAGVGQIQASEGRSLLIGRPANLRRWAASHLGAGRPSRKGVRPPVDLRPVATAVAHCATTSGFHQRLVFERLMAAHVSPRARRDLSPPVHLHLDPSERFPRVTVRSHAGAASRGLFGPFRSRAAAQAALAGVHRRFPLRPCDYVFEPAPDLALGLGCVYAQVRTCTAPCLARISEGDYRALADEAAAFLAHPDPRAGEAEPWLPTWVAGLEGGRGLVAERGAAGIELYPVRDGAVVEECGTVAGADELDAGVARLGWERAGAARDDLPWLSAWIHDRRRSGIYIAVADIADVPALARQVRAALGLDGSRRDG